jgi:hypothetical protein
MGSLDEAIREHLELKRAHGAGEDELRRKEQEALGPARREAAPAQESEAPDAEAPAGAKVQAVELPAEPAAPVEEVAAPDASSLAPEAEVPGVEPVAPAEAEPEAEADPDRRPSGNTPTRGFPAVEEDSVKEDVPAGDPEDVLEETPEFLQDTPDHDKLWFEQKPPRDFKFDE